MTPRDGMGRPTGVAGAASAPSRGTRLTGALAATATAVLGAFAASAGAATPIQVGNGADVSIAVDSAGAGHVAWRRSSPEATRYCRVPTGTTGQGCPALSSFPPRVGTNGLFGRGLVALSGNTVAVLWRECCAPEEVNARVSTNLGASFGPLRTLAAVGADNPTGTTGDAITDGAAVGWSDGVSFQTAALAGPTATSRADLFGPVSFGSVSALRGGRPLVVEESDTKLLSFRRNTTGDANSEANWTAAKPIATAGTGFKRPSLAFDSTDVFLAYTDTAGGGPNRPLVRRYVAASDSFGSRVRVAGESADEIDVAVDGTTGRVHVVWSNGSGVWWSSSRNRGASFGSPVRLTGRDGVTHLHVGAGGGDGWAGFRTIDGRVSVVPLEASNRFRLGGVRKNKRKGTAKLKVKVPGPGELDLARNRKVKPKHKVARAEGRVKLPIKLRGKANRRLRRTARRKGKAKVTVRAKVTFRPEGGEPRTKARKVRLKRRRPR